MAARKKQKFAVTEFINRSGSMAWRVSGVLGSRRIRKNFKSAKEAREAAELYAEESLSIDSGRRRMLTTLSANQIRIAEMLFERAGEDDAVLNLLPLVRAAERKRIEPALISWLDGLERSGRRAVTVKVNRYVGQAFRRAVTADFVDEIRQDEVRDFVFAHASRETQRDRRQRIGQFFKFCVNRGWCVRNPAEDIPAITIERDLPAILSTDQVKRLLKAAGQPVGVWTQSLEPYVLLNAFCGLRPAESVKVLFGEFHLSAELACIEVSPRLAKVGLCRQAELLPEVRGRLKGLCRGMKKDAAVYFGVKHWTRVREKAGLFEVWKKDIMRHTYASWHYALFKDIDRLAYTMGNSREVLFSNYIRPMTAADAQKYINIL